MKDMIYLLLDILTYCAQGALLGMLLDTAQARFPFPEYMKKGILLLQYAVVQSFLHESGWVRNLFYENSVVSDSRQSIWPVLASMLVTCVVSGILLWENRLKLFYGIVTFYSVTELLKMAFHPVLLWVLRKLVDLNDYLFLKKQLYGEEMFYAAVSGIEIFWNILLAGTVLIFSYEILRRVKKYLALKEVHERSQLIFLLFPSLIGFLLCLMLRSMMFSMDGMDMYLLLDSRPEMNLLIPCVCWLCVLMILLAAKMLLKLINENNHKIEVSVYRDRILEMEQHIGDIENLYAGIRGMRHDMKNYIADMEALMSGQPEQTPLRQYLNSLQTSVEQLDMKYHTGNPVTDVILQRYVKLTEKSGIDFQADFLFPANMNIDAFDLSIILNNALDNALEACKRQKEGKKFMELKAYRRENMFFIILKNSFDGSLNRDKEGGRLRTTKTDAGEHGLGLRNIEMCAEKYYGKEESTVRDKEFELAVMLQRGISG